MTQTVPGYLASTCFWPPLPVPDCSWSLMTQTVPGYLASTCFWPLLPVPDCSWLTLPVSDCSWPPLPVLHCSWSLLTVPATFAVLDCSWWLFLTTTFDSSRQLLSTHDCSSWLWIVWLFVPDYDCPCSRLLLNVPHYFSLIQRNNYVQCKWWSGKCISQNVQSVFHIKCGDWWVYQIIYDLFLHAALSYMKVILVILLLDFFSIFMLALMLITWNNSNTDIAAVNH